MRWERATDGYIRGKATCPYCGKRMKFHAKLGELKARAECDCGCATLLFGTVWEWEIDEQPLEVSA